MPQHDHIDSVTRHLLCQEYGLGQILFVESLKGAHTKGFVVQTTTGKWVARRRATRDSEPTRINFDHAALIFLARQGARVTSPCANRSGQRLLQSLGNVWELFPYISGNSFEIGNQEMTISLATELGKFHHIGQQFPGRFDKPAIPSEPNAPEVRRMAQQFFKAMPMLEPDEVPFMERIDAAEQDLVNASVAALPHTLIHGEVTPEHVLTRGAAVSGFVGYYAISWKPRVLDIAFALLHCCLIFEREPDDLLEFPQDNEGSAQRELVADFINAYCTVAEPLSDRERISVNALLSLHFSQRKLTEAAAARREDRIAVFTGSPRSCHALFV